MSNTIFWVSINYRDYSHSIKIENVGNGIFNCSLPWSMLSWSPVILDIVNNRIKYSMSAEWIEGDEFFTTVNIAIKKYLFNKELTMLLTEVE